MKVTFTKIGWGGLCPVYWEEDDEGAIIEARPPWLMWWFWINSGILLMFSGLITACSPEKTVVFAIWGVKDLDEPFTVYDGKTEN